MIARWLINFLVIFSLFTSCDVGNRSLEVISFNIRYDNPEDGINSWDNRKDLVFDFIHKESPDVIGLQEVLLNQYKDLQGYMNDYESVAAGREDGQEAGEMAPIFYKKNEFELISSSHFWLSNTPEIPGSMSWGAMMPRIVTWVQLKNIHNGYIFYVFNTHFSHISPYARNESAILLLEKIRLLAGKAPVIITGDFNDSPSSRTYKTLTNNWKDHSPLWDTRYENVKAVNQKYKTFNGFCNDTTEVVIDHIFVNGLFLVQGFQTYPIKEDDKFISDHFPIKATLSFRLNEIKKEGDPVELVQSLQEPTFDNDQIAFTDHLLIPISINDNSGTLYYTVDGSIPDTSSNQYSEPIDIKKTTTISAYVYSPGKYPSRVVTKTFIKKKNIDVKVINIFPTPTYNFCGESFACLFDMTHGTDSIHEGSWLGIDAKETTITCELNNIQYIEDIYISYLSQPRNGIFSPNAIEVAYSTDSIKYNLLGSITLVPSTDIQDNQKSIINVKGQEQKAKYIKLTLKGLPKMPAAVNLDGAPKIYIDEIIIQ